MPSTANSIDQQLAVRRPRLQDGRRLWQFVRESSHQGWISSDFYLLLCYHFPDTCVVAEEGDDIVGFLAAYRSPLAEGTVFVWQLCVGLECRDTEIATHMLTDLLDRDVSRDVRYLEATVCPTESAQQAAMRGLARRFGTVCEERPLFQPHLFAEEDHEEEWLYRVGPLEVLREEGSSFSGDSEGVPASAGKVT